MGLELVVLDFDGTLTNVDEEAVPAVQGWKNDLRETLGFSEAEFSSVWEDAQSRILSEPSQYGWIMGDKIIAPPYASPMVMARTISEVLFDDAGKYLQRVEREELLQNHFFKRNYKNTKIVFKEGADSFLQELKKLFEVVIVTNSGTNDVVRKLAHLESDHSELNVAGGAKKYVINNGWVAVPESEDREGFGRPLFLRRENYWNVLSDIMNKAGVGPNNVTVVGDIYEMDLLLPEYAGMHTALTPRSSTPSYEIDAVTAYDKGYLALGLEDVLGYLSDIRKF
jgi:FMN phosphatase YigB (HAD superfamily)